MIYRGYIITRAYRRINSMEQMIYIAKLMNKPKVCLIDTLLGFTLEEIKNIIDAERRAIKIK